MSIKEIQRELGRLGDSQNGLFLQRFFNTGVCGYGEGDLFRGVSVPALRNVAKKYLRNVMMRPLKAITALTKAIGAKMQSG